MTELVNDGALGFLRAEEEGILRSLTEPFRPSNQTTLCLCNMNCRPKPSPRREHSGPGWNRLAWDIQETKLMNESHEKFEHHLRYS